MKVTTEPMIWTHFGWARISLTPPKEVDMLWIKMPEKHTYGFDGDGWYRIDPAEPQRIPDGDLNHG